MQTTRFHWLHIVYRVALVLVVAALALVPVARAEPGINVIPPLHLPLVLGDPVGPLPTNFTNGDFEAGPVDWEQGSTGSFDNIVSDPPTFITPHSGAWVSWLGGVDDETGYIQQTIMVSAGKPWLVFYHFIDSIDECGYDFAYVMVNGSPIATNDLCDATIHYDWEVQGISLAAYIGQVVTVRFELVTDETNYSSLFLDDISMQAAAP